MAKFPFTNPGVDISIAFDFHADDVNLDHPDKYSSRFHFTTNALVKVQPLFNKTNVRFKATASEINNFLNNSGAISLIGYWLCITQPGPSSDLRKSNRVNWIPTGVIYHQIKIDKDYFNQVLTPLILSQVIRKKGQVIEMSNQERKISFLNGRMSITVTDSFDFPVLNRIANNYNQKITFSARGGSGLTSDDVNKIWDSISLNGDRVADIIPVPILFFYQSLPDDKVDLNHKLNPLRIASGWRALYFRSQSIRNRYDMQWLKQNKPFFRNLKVFIHGELYKMPAYGVVFFEVDSVTNSLQLSVQNQLWDDLVASDIIDSNEHFLSVITYDGSLPPYDKAIELSLLDGKNFNHLTATVYLELDYGEIVHANPDKFYDITPTLANLQSFINTISNIHLNTTITHAGAFAKSMEFIALAVVDYLSAPKPSSTSETKVIVPKSFAYKYTLYIGCILFVDKLDDDRPRLLGELEKIDINLSGFTRHDWMNDHGDDQIGPPTSGWKSFDLPAEKIYLAAGVGGARKTHFLVAALYVEDNFFYFDYIVGPFTDWTSNYNDPDEEIDKIYHVKGREFQDWLEDEFDATKVEEKLIELVVAQSALDNGVN